MSTAHLFIGFANPPGFISTPIPFLVLLGIGYGLLGVMWSAIPILVPEETGLQGTAFGIATAIFNLSTFLFPMVIAVLINVDPSYFGVQIMFATCCALGGITSHMIPRFDRTGKMDAPESANAEPAVARENEVQGRPQESDQIPLVDRTRGDDGDEDGLQLAENDEERTFYDGRNSYDLSVRR
jgi:hypothetical protein